MNDESDLPAHVLLNRAHWDASADRWAGRGARDWERAEPVWGIWGLPESELRMLPDDMTGLDAVELGRGTAYVSGWMTRRGARVTGIDVSERQLATARRLAAAHGVTITLVHGTAEATPFPDESFDFAISEYGAAIWCDPYAWVPEAYRVLRPGGRLVFLGNHPLMSVCSPQDGSPVTFALERDYFSLHRLRFAGDDGGAGTVEFSLTFAEWLRLFRRVGFVVEELIEPPAPPEAEGVSFAVPAAWGRRFPAEHVWKLRKP